jgi:PiT family inorganic phosphate transporter
MFLNQFLIFAAALLSFAHGANDVANAIGPLAAILEVMSGFGIHKTTHIPLSVVLIGACGIALGLAIYGPRLIRVVGSEITALDQTRAYSVSMAVAITILIATELSLPVSTTHTTVGAILGVGFLREYIKQSHLKIRQKIAHHLDPAKTDKINRFLDAFYAASFLEKRKMLKDLQTYSNVSDLSKKELNEVRSLYLQTLVERSTVMRIVLFWIATIPAAGILAAGFFLLFKQIL